MYWFKYDLSYSVSVFHTLPSEIAMNILSVGILSLVFPEPETEEEKKYAHTDMVLFGGLYCLNFFNPATPSASVLLSMFVKPKRFLKVVPMVCLFTLLNHIVAKGKDNS